MLRAEVFDYAVQNLPMFVKQLSKGTMTVKPPRDIANGVALAQKAVIETEREIETLRTDTEVLSRQINQVIVRMTAASLHALLLHTHNNIPTISAELGFNLSLR